MTDYLAVVQLPLYIGEDWVQALSFFSDPLSDPQTLDIPLALNAPVMAVKQAHFNVPIAEFNPGATGLGAGRTTVSGVGLNLLTLHLPFAWTYRFEGMTELSFDIFDVIGGNRIALVKDGVIVIDGATTAADGT